MIRKTKRGFQVISHSGKALSKPNLSKAAAEKRLGQVEYFKHHPHKVTHTKHQPKRVY